MEILLTFVVLLFGYCEGTPLKSPDFVSRWYTLTVYSGLNSVNIEHGLGELPVYVQVQVKSTSEPNKDFIFPGVGHALRDDDENLPHSGMVYLYNETNIYVSTPTPTNGKAGSAVYTENSQRYEGPNSQDSFSALVRVRLWKSSSFPKPDYHSSGDSIGSRCDITDSVCFYEKLHNFDEYPSLVLVRTKLNDTSKAYNGYIADAVGKHKVKVQRSMGDIGASHAVYSTSVVQLNGYVIYGFNTSAIRVWTDSSAIGALFDGQDGYIFKETYFLSGELEIMAWRPTTLQQDFENSIEMGAIPGTFFEMETSYILDTQPETDSIVGVVWVEAQDGDNNGFRFPGTGAMVFSLRNEVNPCSYGGLTYAYTNTTLRLWKPSSNGDGKLVCIADIFAGGKYSQASNNGRAVMKIWTVSSLDDSCSSDDDCKDQFSECTDDSICQCQAGYYRSQFQCRKELGCSSNVSVIPELALRHRNYLLESGPASRRPVDDSSLTESWYRADSGEGQWLMPDSNSPPGFGSCGSNNPFYIKNTHPNIDDLTEEGTTVEVQGLQDTSSIFNITLRKCEQTVQYRLSPIARQSFVFCFDSPKIQGQIAFDDAPTDVSIGNLEVKVDLQFEVEELADGSLYNPYLVFRCESDNLLNIPDNLYFTTYWFVDGDLLEAFGPFKTISNLTEQTLLNHSKTLGINVQCGVQLSVSKIGYKTAMVESGKFYAGIKFQSKTLVMRKGETATVVFEPTIPIGCRDRDGFDHECIMDVFIKPQDENICERKGLIAVQSRPRCGTEMKALKPGESWEQQSYEFNVTTEDNNYNDKYFFRLQLITGGLGHQLWRSYQLDDVAVHATYSDETKYKLCYSHVDPHQRTADGYSYEHQYEGQFILYRNTKYGVEVQMKTTTCNKGRAFCACSVAIRAGGDVFVANLCGGSRFIGFTSCTDNGILGVKKIGEFRYKVNTPIGTYIDILMRSHPGYLNLMNLDIYMAPKDIQATEGLCGFFDNDITNDLRKRNSNIYYPIDTTTSTRHYHSDFSNEWRIKDTETNYMTYNKDPIPRWETSTFCACNQTGDGVPLAVCSPSLHVICPTEDAAKNIQCVTFETQTKKAEVARRLNLSNVEPPTTVQKREVPDISEAEAEVLCRDAILNHTVVTEFGHRLIGIDVEVLVMECTVDVSEQDDASWTSTYPLALKNIIEIFNEKDPEYIADHEEEVSQFTALTCDCRGHGVCKANGDCECSTGYGGPDCSLDASAPLTIRDIYGGGFCDTSDQNSCDCLTIQADNLQDGFSCSVIKRQIRTNGDEVSQTTTIKGVFVDIFNGMCCISDLNQRRKRQVDDDDVYITKYDVSISNDASTFGTSVTVTVFDSSCQNVSDPDAGFVLEEDTCFIEGQCKAENDTAENDNCLSCMPSFNIFAWTNVCSPSDESSSSLLLIAVICSCVAVILLAFIGGFVVSRFAFKSKKVLPSVQEVREATTVEKYDFVQPYTTRHNEGRTNPQIRY